MAVVTSNPPEQGQLVTVRQRQYVVSEVAKSTLPATPLQPLDGHGQHLVTLASVEDDALGEELQVIWELELGAAVIEDVPLPEPTGFDAPDRLDAFLDAVRWGRPRPPTFATSSPRSVRASRLKTTNSIRWSARFRCPGSACSLLTTWASARPSRPAWSIWNW